MKPLIAERGSAWYPFSFSIFVAYISDKRWVYRDRLQPSTVTVRAEGACAGLSTGYLWSERRKAGGIVSAISAGVRVVRQGLTAVAGYLWDHFESLKDSA